jgi:hypothetical protein
MGKNSLAFNNFNRNMQSCEDMIGLYEVITEQLPSLKENAKDILRSVIILSVSALDTFFHDFYRTEIVESYLDNSSYSIDFNKINISIGLLKDLNNAKSDDEKRRLLAEELRKIQKTDAYQSPKSIEYIFANLGISKIWSEIEKIDKIKLTANEIKEELGLIIDRRNKISHESDWDYFNQEKYDITKETSQNVVDFINKFIESINDISKMK